MNQFTEVYETWPDDQMIEAYKQKNNYQEAAVEALLQVMQRRNLTDEVRKIQLIEQLNEKLIKEEAMQLSKEKAQAGEVHYFGAIIPEREYALKARQADGTFFKTTLSKQKNYALAGWCLALGLVLVIAFFLVLFSESLFPDDMIYFGTGAIILSVMGVFIMFNGKAFLRLYENDKNEIFLEIKSRRLNKKIQFPFPYSFASTTINMRISSSSTAGSFTSRFKKPVLFFAVQSASEEKILISEELSAWDDDPEWERITETLEKIKHGIQFYIYGLKKNNLRVLKKIMDELFKNE